MLTVLESINLTTDFLQKKGIEEPRINAELLLAHILKCKRLDLYLKFDRPLSQEETDLYREYLKRRAGFEPLQYIIGDVEFYGLKFKVDRSVLIPRPETEILVEKIIDDCKEKQPLRILDIGTGSGIIPICLAKHLEVSNFLALDKDEAALKISRENAELNNVEERIDFVHIDITNSQNEFDNIDVIVSNPPYVSIKDYQELRPELKNFEPRIALTDESDGLTFYKLITKLAIQNLKIGGKLYFEVGQDQSAEVTQIMKEQGFIDIGVKKDYLQIDRVIYGVKN